MFMQGSRMIGTATCQPAALRRINTTQRTPCTNWRRTSFLPLSSDAFTPRIWALGIALTTTMIWRLLTSFSLVCALASAAAVTGHVSITESGHEGSKFADPAGTVVWLEPLETVSTPGKLQAGAFRMVQKNKTFTPHVLAIPAGSTVEFPNSDPIFHNAFSNYDGQIFDIGLYPPGTTRSITFRRPGAVRVFCNIHAAMSAVILVVDTPYFAVTDESGAFSIEGMPKGT